MDQQLKPAKIMNRGNEMRLWDNINEVLDDLGLRYRVDLDHDYVVNDTLERACYAAERLRVVGEVVQVQKIGNSLPKLVF